MEHPIRKPAATLSLDLDNLWAYLKTRGDNSWRDYPSYLDRAVPRMLDLLDTVELKITVFAVGRDVDVPGNAEIFSDILRAAHEIGNHSYEHSVNFHRADTNMVLDEIERTENAITAIGGRQPVGFRGPSFRLSDTILRILAQRGYRYDASTFPTIAGPLARAYYRVTSNLDAVASAQIGDLFGSVREGRRPLAAYRWGIDNNELTEVPVTTFPIFRTPIHMTYINFIADYSSLAARTYLSSALRCCRVAQIAPSLLLHASDFIGSDDPDHPKFLPGMKRTSNEKMELLREILVRYRNTFDVMTIENFVEKVSGARELKTLIPTEHL